VAESLADRAQARNGELLGQQWFQPHNFGGSTVETLLGALVFAASLLAQIAAVVAVHAERTSRGSDAFDAHAMFTHGVWWTCVALGTLLPSCSTYAQELNGVAHKFLQRHGVPCLFVVKVGSPSDMGEVATCQDGREWALFWLEDEIAFVHPQTRESYKWDRQIYVSHPEIYTGPNPHNEHQLLLSNGP
jgi:hypothetical protein